MSIKQIFSVMKAQLPMVSEWGGLPANADDASSGSPRMLTPTGAPSSISDSMAAHCHRRTFVATKN